MPRQTSNNWLQSLADNVVLLAIFLVIVHIFVQDLARLLVWSWDVRRILIIIGFGFDLFFTIEFLLRLFGAMSNRRVGYYLWYERGWVDFIASIPLLLLNSGPNLLALITGEAIIAGIGGVAKVLKIVKAVRIARILRLLRVLKIFKRIKHADSAMAQRHLAQITTTAITTFIATLILVSALATLIDVPTLDSYVQELPLHNVEQQLPRDATDDAIALLTNSNPGILIIEEEGQTRYTRYNDEYYLRNFGPSDYVFMNFRSYNIYLDIRPIHAEESRQNITHFIVILALVLVFLFIYSPHFAITITDPINIMWRGFAEKSYNLEIKIPKRFRRDDIYRLAELYNEIYLPLKDRSEGEDSVVVDIRLDDLKDFLEQE